jgi:hypothetical protein
VQERAESHAGSRTLVKSIATGNNAHSVAVDPGTGQVFLPASSAAAPAGCTGCDNVLNGGVIVYSTQ